MVSTEKIMDVGTRSIRTVRHRHLTQKGETMNAEQLRGKWMQVKGDLNLQKIEGSFDKILGMLQERYGSNCVSLVREQYGEKKEELMRWADQWQQRSQAKATREQTGCSSTAQGRHR